MAGRLKLMPRATSAQPPAQPPGIPVLTIDQAPHEPPAAAAPEAGHPRSWRNKNPGNLRTVPLPERWRGQIAVDNAPGGPFAIFDTRVNGWRALTKLLLTYRDKHNLRSVRAILTRYAPDMENDTNSYVAAVAKSLGVSPLDAIDVRDPFVMRALLHAIARHEGGRACPAWPDAELVAGMMAAGLSGP